ncbi:MAG: PAS domain S-box protein [Methanolinea sp.]|nr:PAS domain S-box protein [Methanolinea sp.]
MGIDKPPSKELAPSIRVVLVFLSTLFVLAVTVFSLTSNITIIYQNAYYIPIILACYYFQRRGLFYSVFLTGIYFVSLVFVYPTVEIAFQGFIRVLFFLLTALIVTYLVEKLETEKARYKGIFANSESGIILWRRDSGRVIESNPTTSDMTGYTGQELATMSISDIFRDPESVQELGGSGKPPFKHREGKVKTKDGGEIDVLFSMGSIDEGIGTVTFQDITERKKTEEAISLANRKLNLLNSITRHDILNSLTALLGYLELSRDIVRDEEMKKYVEAEIRSAETIRKQIEFTRDYQDVGVKAPSWFSVRTLIQGLKSRVEREGIGVSLDLPDVEIYADPLVEKVFYNLMENAVRHGKKVTRIWFTARKQGDDLVIQCCDNGVGVPADKKKAIFNREYFQHSGFGLFLSREILAITGISLEETGVPGEGAVFSLVVPRGAYRMSPL